MLRDGLEVLSQAHEEVADRIVRMAIDQAAIPMVSRTHGQIATPTTLGKEMANVFARLKRQMASLQKIFP